MPRRRKGVLVLSRVTTHESLVRAGGRPPGGRSGLEAEWLARTLEAHRDHEQTLDTILGALRRLGIETRLVRTMNGEDPSGFDLVVTAGGDGTVLYASHHVDATPMLGVRSSRHSAGYLTGATRSDVARKLEAFARGRLEPTTLHRMSVYVGGRLRHDKVLNEALFSHPNPAVTTRYVLEAGGRCEEQMSSGIWVGPAAGSTAAMRSAGGRVLAPSSRNLQFIVREPIKRFALARGLIAPGRDLRILNRREPARLYLDGPHLVVRVGPWQEVRTVISDRPLEMLGWPGGRRPRRS